MKIIFNNTELEVFETDESYRYRKLMGGAYMDTLTLYFAGPNFLEIPIGAYVVYEGQKYTHIKSQDFEKVSNSNYGYTLTLYGEAYITSCTKVQNPIDRRMKFSYTAKPHEHLQLIVDNLNRRNSGWRVGDYIDATEKTISYNFTFAIDALAQLADLYNTEYDIRNKTISLRKIEYNKENPLALSYGAGNGFKPNVGRKTPSSVKVPVEVLYVQGGERNIDFSTYGSHTLLLPKSQILEYEGREYISDADGYSIQRNDKDIQYNNEDGFDATSVYPQWEHTVTDVEVTEDGFYDIFATNTPDCPNNSPASLNYNECRIQGEKATIIFQSGMLSGKEFDIVQSDARLSGYNYTTKGFQLVSAEIDGMDMPCGSFVPKIGDRFRVFGVMLPETYICDNDTQAGASWDMFREAAKHFYENEDPKFTFEGQLDGIWSKDKWLEIGGKITIGGYVLFSDDDFAQDGIKIRIIGIKDFVKRPHSPELELSNDVIGISVGTELDKIPAQQVDIIEAEKSAIRYARRGFRDVKETSEMLMDALLNFSGEINPIVVRTMQLIAGDESLQFQFVDDRYTPKRVTHNIEFNPETKQLTSEAVVMQHMTLGITSLSSAHHVSEYKYWSVEKYTSPVLSEPMKRYYLYIKASKTEETAVMLLSESAIALDEVEGHYHFLTGVLNTEHDGDRSYVDLYGFTEVLPGRVTTDKIISADGTSYFDLVNNVIKMGGDGKFIAPSITFSKANGEEAELKDVIDGVETNIDYINSDNIFSINEKLAIRVEWERISGRADAEHTPSEAGESGSYSKTLTSATEAGVNTEELTAQYQKLLTLFSNDLIVVTANNEAAKFGEEVLMYRKYGSLALYQDRNTEFTRSSLSNALAEYYNAESAVKSATTEVKAIEQVDSPFNRNPDGSLIQTEGFNIMSADGTKVVHSLGYDGTANFSKGAVSFTEETALFGGDLVAPVGVMGSFCADRSETKFSVGEGMGVYMQEGITAEKIPLDVESVTDHNFANASIEWSLSTEVGVRNYLYRFLGQSGGFTQIDAAQGFFGKVGDLKLEITGFELDAEVEAEIQFVSGIEFLNSAGEVVEVHREPLTSLKANQGYANIVFCQGATLYPQSAEHIRPFILPLYNSGVVKIWAHLNNPYTAFFNSRQQSLQQYTLINGKGVEMRSIKGLHIDKMDVSFADGAAKIIGSYGAGITLSTDGDINISGGNLNIHEGDYYEVPKVRRGFDRLNTNHSGLQAACEWSITKYNRYETARRWAEMHIRITSDSTGLCRVYLPFYFNATYDMFVSISYYGASNTESARYFTVTNYGVNYVEYYGYDDKRTDITVVGFTTHI